MVDVKRVCSKHRLPDLKVTRARMKADKAKRREMERRTMLVINQNLLADDFSLSLHWRSSSGDGLLVGGRPSSHDSTAGL